MKALTVHFVLSPNIDLLPSVDVHEVHSCLLSGEVVKVYTIYLPKYQKILLKNGEYS